MSLALLAITLTVLTIALLAIAIGLLGPFIKRRRARLPKATNPRKDAEEVERPTPLQVDQLTLLPAARAVSGRRRKIAPASEGGGDPTLSGQILNSSLYHEIMHRLELSFNLLESGRISLETYLEDLEVLRRSSMLEAERLRQLASKGRTSEETRLEQEKEVDNVLAAIDWCVQWAKQQLSEARKLRDVPMPEGGVS